MTTVALDGFNTDGQQHLGAYQAVNVQATSPPVCPTSASPDALRLPT